MTDVYEFSATTITGEDRKLSEYRDKVLLIVNVASQCGLTPQYTGLEQLYREHKDAGLVVLGFPCNQFGQQEPGTETEIAEFCSINYDVSFPLFAKIEVNGEGTHPLYRWLKDQQGGLLGGDIKWNFAKFLVGRDGQVIDRFEPTETPEEITPKVVAALG